MTQNADFQKCRSVKSGLFEADDREADTKIWRKSGSIKFVVTPAALCHNI